MRNKANRLEIIKEIIENNDISSQEDLMFKLLNHNIKVTQSTLSRDLKQLKVAKIPNGKDAYLYIIPRDTKSLQEESNHSSIIANSIVSIHFSLNLAVIKTLSGYANAISAIIDSSDFDEFLGTVAGDDTIIVVLKENVDKNNLIKKIKNFYPSINKL